MTPVIVGAATDTHVQHVVGAIESMGCEPPIILDGPALRDRGFTVDLDTVSHDGRELDLSVGGNRGWLRRYAPSAWGTGLIAGSLEAVTLGAFVRLVGAISRLDGIAWLTGVGAMLQAEDRLYQLLAARKMGFPTPRTVVSSDPDAIVHRFGPEFVVKPLGTGYYWNRSSPHAVFSSKMSTADLGRVDFGSAPFVAQEIIPARRHHRVVTVGSSAMVSMLPAAEYDLDWRRDDAAHYSWLPYQDESLARMAADLAAGLDVGYSSQDWIWDGERYVFLDLNPAGQWLFLPEEVAGPVTNAIARYLVGV